jgi:hypothetical protein
MPFCKTCQTEKHQSEFYLGVPRCKECHKAAVKANYQAKMLVPDWREKELDRQRLKEIRRRKEGKVQAPGNKAKLEWCKRNSLKKLAHSKVAAAIKKNKLCPQHCEKCGDKNSEAHHDDYSKPLDVRWLCKTHHAEHHVEMRRFERFTRDQVNQARL